MQYMANGGQVDYEDEEEITMGNYNGAVTTSD